MDSEEFILKSWENPKDSIVMYKVDSINFFIVLSVKFSRNSEAESKFSFAPFAFCVR